MSKLGVHVSAGNRRGFGELLQKCADAGSPVPVVFSVDQDVWPDTQKFSPSTIVIFRHQNKDPRTGGQDGPGDTYTGDPVESARTWMAANMVSWRKNRAHYYAPLNEQDAGTLAGYIWLNDFSVECLRIADAEGFKLALYGFSSGNPRDGATEVEGNRDLDHSTLEQKWEKLLPSLQYAKAHGHILLLHEYGFDSPDANDGPAGSLRASAPYLALRYRRSYRYLHNFNADPLLVIGEAGPGVGYTPDFGDAAWLSDAQWYDSELMRDACVLGCCLYQLGGAENFKDALPILSNHIATTKTLEPEGDPVVDMPEPLPPVPPSIDLTYDRTYYLLHPSQYTLDWAAPAFLADRLWTVGQSPHDAFDVSANQKSRRIIAINPALWGASPTFAEWAAANYPPGYELIEVEASSERVVGTAVYAALELAE